MALSPSVRNSLIAGKGWECGRNKPCFWFSRWTRGNVGTIKEWEDLGWTVLDMLADVTANASKIVVKGGGQAPCPVSEGKLHKTCQGEELAVIFRVCWGRTRREPWRRGGWSIHQLLIHFLMLVTLPWASLPLSLLKLSASVTGIGLVNISCCERFFTCSMRTVSPGIYSCSSDLAAPDSNVRAIKDVTFGCTFAFFLC